MVDPDKCDVNINERNVVILIEKEKNCRNQWQNFDVGPNFHQTQVAPAHHLFVCELCYLFSSLSCAC